MDFFELTQISTQHLELSSPAAPEKLWAIGQYLGLDKNKRMINFGSGYGRPLELWAKDFGISGTGIEIHSFLCERAKTRISGSDLEGQVKIVCGNAADYEFEQNSFDVAVCLGASFIWGGYRRAIREMKNALVDGGKVVVGEYYYIEEKIPAQLRKFEGDLHTELELLHISRDEGFDIEFALRASRDDWDRYVSSNWYGLLRWIDENQTHPDHRYVIDHLHKIQEMYLKYQKKYEGWAIYILNQIKY